MIRPKWGWSSPKPPNRPMTPIARITREGVVCVTWRTTIPSAYSRANVFPDRLPFGAIAEAFSRGAPRLGPPSLTFRTDHDRHLGANGFGVRARADRDANVQQIANFDRSFRDHRRHARAGDFQRHGRRRDLWRPGTLGEDPRWRRGHSADVSRRDGRFMAATILSTRIAWSSPSARAMAIESCVSKSSPTATLGAW